jgi:hypothetical protein
VTDRPGTSVPHPFTEKENDGGELVMYVKKARKKKAKFKKDRREHGKGKDQVRVGGEENDRTRARNVQR